MESYDILVIILSVALGLSLIVWIVAGFYVIQVIKRVRNASDVAKNVADNVSQFTSQLKSAGKITAVGSIISQIAKVMKNKK